MPSFGSTDVLELCKSATPKLYRSASRQADERGYIVRSGSAQASSGGQSSGGLSGNINEPMSSGQPASAERVALISKPPSELARMRREFMR